MDLPFEFDLETLKIPLPGPHPCGVNLQADDAGRKLRAKLRDLREEARRIERRADDGDATEGGWPAAVSLWRQLRDESVTTIREVSRDTAVASLLLESLVRTDGLAGLGFGCHVARTLIKNWWTDLYPIPDPDDGPADEAAMVEERAGPLIRLAGLESEGLLAPALLRVPLTRNRDGETYGLCHWKSSQELVSENDPEKLSMAVSRGAIAPADFAAAVAATPPEHFSATSQLLAATRDAWEGLCEAVSTASNGLATIPGSSVRQFFEDFGTALRTIAPHVAEHPRAPEDGAPGKAVAAVSAGSLNAPSPGTREEAFVQLERIAGYFEQHDPHSLLATQIRNVVRLGRLPRAEYFREVIGDSSALESLFKFVGIGTGPPST